MSISDGGVCSTNSGSPRQGVVLVDKNISSNRQIYFDIIIHSVCIYIFVWICIYISFLPTPSVFFRVFWSLVQPLAPAIHVKLPNAEAPGWSVT